MIPMALKPMYANAELANGRTVTERVLVADKVRYEKTSRDLKMSEESHPITANLLLGFIALKRAGHVAGITWEQFRDGECVDFMLDNDAAGPDASEDPTSES